MAKTLFDHINSIYQDQRRDYFSTLDDSEKRTYSNYMVNRFLSMNLHQLPLVNEIQKYNLPPEIHYLFYATTIPRGKQFNKYVKASRKKEHADWLVELVAKHFLVSKSEADGYIDIYYAQDKSGLKSICELYGIEKKLLKSSGLL
jgi:hypothetical protein